jgi:hypothetical protein
VGILAGNHCLITRNTANRNVDEGIATGSSCTVSFNTAIFNEFDGIDVGDGSSASGAHSLVTGNTVYGNGDGGIEVTCPSDVTNNTASYNGSNYTFRGTNCHRANNENSPRGSHHPTSSRWSAASSTRVQARRLHSACD